MDVQSRTFAYRRSADQDAAPAAQHPVVVVGAGPVGLTLAIELALQQVPVLLLDNDDRLSTGSRAICFAKRTLEVFDRLGCGDAMVDKGVSWSVGRVFHRDAQIYEFNLLAESGHDRPAFINLQQYHVEHFLIERAAALPLIDLRWKNTVTGITPEMNGALLGIDTPDGPYTLAADHVVACDGSRSALRRLMGLEAEGRTFRDRFLIADLTMGLDLPTERRFWFDPPFHPGQSVLLHRQPDGQWRADFQLGWEADPEIEKRPENIEPRVRALLGPDVPFTLGWASVYTFACQRMARFRHGRVIFAGDAAHGVSPFGARGANSGVQDADNLGWKLAAVLQGRADERLLESYATEREAAADENIRASTRSTDFITPKSEVSRLYRDAVLALAREHAFARTLVNSGRLSLPSVLADSPLNTPDGDEFAGPMRPGAAAADAPVLVDGTPHWLLRQMASGRFHALLFDASPQVQAMVEVAALGIAPLTVLAVAPAGAAGALVDAAGLVAQRYDLRPGTLVLLRPDQHVVARWRNADAIAVRAALQRALARS